MFVIIIVLINIEYYNNVKQLVDAKHVAQKLVK